MLFQHTWEWLFRPSPHTGLLKTQTRRRVQPNHFVGEPNKDGKYVCVNRIWHDKDGRQRVAVAYAIGDTYAIQPGRGKRTIWWRRSTAAVDKGRLITTADWQGDTSPWDGVDMVKDGWLEGRFKLMNITRQDVRDLTQREAILEGFKNPMHFLQQWTWMHDLQGAFVIDDQHEDTYHYYAACEKKWQTVDERALIDEHLRNRPLDRYHAWVLQILPPVMTEALKGSAY